MKSEKQNSLKIEFRIRESRANTAEFQKSEASSDLSNQNALELYSLQSFGIFVAPALWSTKVRTTYVLTLSFVFKKRYFSPYLSLISQITIFCNFTLSSSKSVEVRGRKEE